MQVCRCHVNGTPVYVSLTGVTIKGGPVSIGGGGCCGAQQGEK